jgi:hypothetical protein
MISALLVVIALSQGAKESTLWQIGQPDGTPLKFGLAPGGYSRYTDDPDYIVGISTPRDWPYVLPGPQDSWANERVHEGDITFGLSGVSADSTARLTIQFSDSQNAQPPKLRLLVNGTPYAVWNAPRGKGDDVIFGKANSGVPSQWVVDIPGRLFKPGNNVIGIRSEAGSWVLYDAIRFEGSNSLKLIPVERQITIVAMPPKQVVLRTPSGPRQAVELAVSNIGPAVDAKLAVGSGAEIPIRLRPGRQTIQALAPPVKSNQMVRVRMSVGDRTTTSDVTLQPVRPWMIYVFPHSHVDIGYTGLQTDVLKMHQRNLFDAIEVARESASNPSDSRYRLNVEATWVLDRLLQTATPAQQKSLARALREKTLSVSADYANLLTGLMHPEELMQGYRFSRILQDRFGVPIDTATQTDVPGVTWGDVVAMNEAGVKYLVLMPNPSDRIGGVRHAWEDKPFFWVGPSGVEKVLVWETDSYAVGVGAGWDGDRSKIYRSNDPAKRFIGSALFPKLDRLVRNGYPYDIVGLPWSFTDNPPVDGDVAKAAKAWNERYEYPHVVLSTWSDACRELVRRYGSKLPLVRGDLTPYWEDGSGSSAAETALNRISPNRILQAGALFAMRPGHNYPAAAFLEAWRNVLLYSEHTWGAYNSTSEPDNALVKAEWAIKQSFALTADRQSKMLLAKAMPSNPAAKFVVVDNTSSWTRTDLIVLPAGQSTEGDRVVDEAGLPLPSQRLRTGDLAVLVRDVPGFGSRRIRLKRGTAYVASRAFASGLTLRNSTTTVALDPATGAVASIQALNLGKQVVDTAAKWGLNQFLTLRGGDLKGILTNSRPVFEVVESGPLVATIRATSQAPGAKSLRQEVTLVAGLDRIDLTNVIDKLAVRETESVHFAFPFAVPGGQMRIDMPWALVRPELDQIAGANKNWLPTHGYVDVSNASFGVTCASLDAPLIEVGGITANLLGGVYDWKEWRQHIPPTQAFYSWALNNIWYTNYRADQEGKLTFRYRLRVHKAFESDAASRFGIDAQQPLNATRSSVELAVPVVSVSDPAVLITSLCPSDDGKALIVRLWNTGGKPSRVRLRWRGDLVRATRTDLSQRPGAPAKPVLDIPGYGVMTLRAEFRSSARPRRKP